MKTTLLLITLLTGGQAHDEQFGPMPEDRCVGIARTIMSLDDQRIEAACIPIPPELQN